nr:MAG TPA: Toxin SymE, type I toxin-antitoxin system [Caudoviricetes sp.]
MAKLNKMKYRTVGGDLKINTYIATVSKKIVKESGIDPEKEITVKAEKGKIIIEQKR